MMQALAKLDNNLESWRTGLPTEVQPTPSAQVDNLDIIQLHLSYYASTWKIYTALAKLYNTPLTSIEREQPNLHLSTLIPTHSARATLSTLQGLSSQPFASLWQMICYPMCAVLILLTAVLHGPRDSQASLNVEWIEKFVVFLQSFQDREGCDLNGLIEFCSNLYDVASFAQRDPTDVYTDLRIRLRGSQDPMLLAQGLLANMPLLGAKATEVFSGVVAGARVDGFTRLVPNVLKPRSFNFFGYNEATNRH
ncbi:transcriptional activator Mut3p [Fusarium agapanthi]|uniref:Transcriptional activator Mut3p n=1 Tax=Fusarium agapanthi TaxID=1803897 RepID=A0A9P5AZP7_9HYPO|nr:transcriptional activator Mut3p [Fusarium agapanthi]